MKNLKSISITQGLQAVQAEAIFEFVCDELGIGKQKRSSENHYGSPSDFYLGLNIKSKFEGEASPIHQKLVQATMAPKSGNLAWFGFVAGQEDSLLRQVWLWTDTLNTAENLKRCLKDGGIPEATITAFDKDEDGRIRPYVLVSEPAGGKPLDVDFFDCILRLAAGVARR